MYSHYRQGEDTINARAVLLKTCRLSRKTVWEVWKEAVWGIEVDEEKTDVYEELGVYFQELVDAKEELVEKMNERIR